MTSLTAMYDALTERLRSASDILWPFLLRAILFWEFYEAGHGKLNGTNWFASISEKFPLPFRWLSADTNWIAATWGELIFSILLLLGLFTRFAAFSLIIITAVATAAVHWPESFTSISQLWEGYAVSNKGAGNFKLPLLYTLMLLALVFHGGGKLSLDNLLLKATGRSKNTESNTQIDSFSYALVAMLLGSALIWVLPKTGISLFIIAAAFGIYGKMKS